MNDDEILVRLVVLDERLSRLSRRIDELAESQEAIIAQSNRWKGGLAVLVALGAVIGAVSTFFGARLLR